MANGSSPLSSPLVSTLVIEALIALWILFRSLRTYRGRPLVVSRVVAFPVLTMLLWLAAEAATIVSIPGSYPGWTLVDAGLVVVGALAIQPLAARLISVYLAADGQWMYRYGIELIAFYLTSWVVRLALAAYFDPASLDFTSPPSGPAITGLAASVMQVVEILLSLSTGLVVGRAAATYRLYRRAAGTPAPTSAPLP